MEPATIFALTVTFGAAAWLFATAFIPAACRVVFHAVGHIPSLLAPSSFVVSLILAAGVVRPSGAVAVTPPPSVRLVVGVGTTGETRVEAAPYPVSHNIGRSASRYVVEHGDSLWRIARDVLSGSIDRPTGEQITRLWKEIYRINRDVIGSDPNLILPGQTLSIPGGTRG